MAMIEDSKIVDHRGRHLELVTDSIPTSSPQLPAGWMNQLTGHGTSRDKRSYGEIAPVEPAQNRQKFEDIYHGDDIAATIVDRPVEDMLRKWVRLNVTMGDDADANTAAASEMMDALNVIGAQRMLSDGLTWANVFGGSIAWMQIDDGSKQDPAAQALPLRENSIRRIEGLEVYDRWDVEIEEEYSDPEKDGVKYGQPKTYRLNTRNSVRGQATMPEFVIHESRVLRFDGVRVNRRRLQRNSGWHDPVYVRLEPVLRDFGISWGTVGNLLADFATAVFKAPKLDKVLKADGDGIVMDRLQLLDMCRSVMRMIPMDTDESFERSVTPVAGLAELLTQFILRLSAAARMPVSILWGQAPSGLNSTAEGDLSVWYDRIQSRQLIEVAPPLTRLINLLWKAREGPTRGREPEAWALEFEALWQMSQKEEAESRKAQSETDANYIDTGVLTPEEVAESRFGGDRYSYETQLDEKTREAEAAAAPAPEPEIPQPAAPETPLQPVTRV